MPFGNSGDDPVLSGCLVYFLPKVGPKEAEVIKSGEIDNTYKWPKINGGLKNNLFTGAHIYIYIYK